MTEKTRKIIGENLKAARLKKQLTQKQVAEKAGVSETHYAQAERGEVAITVGLLKDIAEVLEVRSSSILPF